MNRRVLAAALVSVATLVAAVPASAQTLSGKWELTAEGGRGGAQTMTLTLAQDGEKLTGKITMTMGGRRGGGGGSREIEISDGKVDGNKFSFVMTLEFNGNSFSQNYSGTWDGDEMTGQIEGGRGGARPFTGKRADS